VRVVLKALPVSARPRRITLVLTVSDTGPGIPDDQLPRLFTPFSQGDSTYAKRYGGAGLGLSIVKRLVSLMGGEICLDSTPGQGTTFYVTFRVGPGTPAEPVFQSANTGPASPSLRILLVEDDEVSQITATNLLQQIGHQVRLAVDGVEALRLLDAEPFELVIMDIQLPVMDGVEATQRIRTSGRPYANVPIMAMTAYALKGDREKFLQSGIDDYLAKPFSREALIEGIDRVMRRH